MSEEHLLSFDRLDINTKRNQISDDLIIMDELIKNFGNKYNIQNNIKIKNYNQASDKDLTEGEMLTFFYEDIYKLEQELIKLLTIMDNK